MHDREVQNKAHPPIWLPLRFHTHVVYYIAFALKLESTRARKRLVSIWC
jgi:integral membrane sensor domain MASE1